LTGEVVFGLRLLLIPWCFFELIAWVDLRLRKLARKKVKQP
jgi:hypothetical protein